MPESFEVATADGHRFSVSLFRAPDVSAPLLVFWPAMGTPGKVYRHLATALAGEGVQVCLADWRGMASSSMRPSLQCDFGFRDLVEQDAPALLRQLVRRVPGAPLWVGGHSLGGQMAALIAASQPQQVIGLVAVSSGAVYLPCFSLRLQIGMRLAGTVAALTGTLLGYFPGTRLGFAGKEARTLMKDWYHVVRCGRYAPSGSSIDYEAALGRLTIPALTLNFKNDTWAPAAIAKTLMAKLPACERESWLWGDAECGGTAFDHFSWIRQPDRIAPVLSSWIRQHAPDVVVDPGTALQSG